MSRQSSAPKSSASRFCVPIRMTVCILTAVLFLPLTLTNAAAGQTPNENSQTDWHTIDEPRLEGPKSWWFRERSSKGHANDYHWTTAIGDSAKSYNVAVWDMGRRSDRQELQAYVPCNHAVATMTYKVQIDNAEYRRRIVQSDHCGWVRLGIFAIATDGRDVTVTLEDNASDQDFRDYASRDTRYRDQFVDGTPPDEWLDAFFGVDAMRMKCVSGCRSDAPPAESGACTASDASALFWSHVGTPSVGAQRILDIYCEAASVQCPGRFQWHDIAAIALKESTHGQLGSRTADILGASGNSREFDVRTKSDNGLIFSRATGFALGSYAGLYGIPRNARPTDARYDLGPMQFAPATWEEVWRNQAREWDGKQVGHGTNGAFPDPHNFRDAVHAAAAHLCHLYELTSLQPWKNSGKTDQRECAFAMYNAGAGRRLSEFYEWILEGSPHDRVINCDDFLLSDPHIWSTVKDYVRTATVYSAQYSVADAITR